MIRVSYAHEDLDLDLICNFVLGAYWSAGWTDAKIRAAAAACRVVGLYDGKEQLGYARAISDGVFHAYVLDLFIVEKARGQGLSKRLMQALLEHPELQDVRVWLLSTRDAHGLYEKFGFERVDAGRMMRLERA